MVSNRLFATSLHLNDGRALSTLAQARELIIAWPQASQAMPRWASAGLLARAAASWGRYPPVSAAVDPSWRALGAEAI